VPGRAPILFAAAHERGQAFARRWIGSRPAFWCVLAHTDTCMVPGLSAAGVSEELRPLTPAADAEVVKLGVARCLPALPVNPSGAPGPVGITRAALSMAGLDATFIGAGLRVWPATECIRVSDEPGRNITSGRAVPGAQQLFETGQRLGHELMPDDGRLVLGESVPGGTTTALAVLLALGYAAEGRVSGSQPGNAHALKTQVARAALKAAGWEPADARNQPLLAVSRVGDPMQPLAAGIASAVTRAGGEVLLAGGSQMLAVAALLVALGGPQALDRVVVGTTRWIVQDPAADVPGLAIEISPDLPVLAANLDFSSSRHIPLRAFEQWLVKEGVGAGGACIAASLATGQPVEALEAAIDATYDSLLGRLSVAPDTRP
jgi:uncharacterized protein (TIGR00303 family)